MIVLTIVGGDGDVIRSRKMVESKEKRGFQF